MNAAIAQHLNVVEAAIVRIEEWANVLFVVVRGIGARFVSKKVAKVNVVKSVEFDHPKGYRAKFVRVESVQVGGATTYSAFKLKKVVGGEPKWEYANNISEASFQKGFEQIAQMNAVINY